MTNLNPTPEQEWIIEDLIPANLVSLVGGPSGAGKTRWLMEMIDKQWSQGHSVFGHKSFARPYVYASDDRPELSYRRTFRKMGLEASLPAFSCVDLNLETQEQVFKYAVKNFPEARVLIVEGFGGMVPQGKGDYTSVKKFLKKSFQLCTNHNLTLIGVVHSPKMKPDEKYSNPRERVLGSMAWAAFTETIIMVEFDEQERDLRHLTLLPRDAASQHLEMIVNEKGLLRETSKDKAKSLLQQFGEKDVRTRILSQLVKSRLNPGDTFKRILLQSVSIGSERAITKALDGLANEGTLRHLAHGQWKLEAWPNEKETTQK